MPDERLSARIEVTGSSEEDLRGIAESFRDVAESAAQAAPAVQSVASAFDEAEDEGSGLARALNSVSESATSATSSMGAIGGATEGAEEGLEDAQEEASGLNRELFQMPASAAAAAAGLSALDDVDLDLGSDARVDVAADTEGVQRVQEAYQTLSDTTVEVDSEGNVTGVQRVKSALQTLEDEDVDIETSGDVNPIHRIRDAVGELEDEEIEVDSEAETSPIRRVQSLLGELDDEEVEIETDADASPIHVVEQALDALEDSTVTVDSEADRSAIQRVRTALGDLEDEEVEIETESEVSPLEQAQTLLGSIDDEEITATSDADVSGVNRLQEALGTLDDETVHVDSSADTSAVQRLNASLTDLDDQTVEITTQADMSGIYRVQEGLESLDDETVFVNVQTQGSPLQGVQEDVDGVRRGFEDAEDDVEGLNRSMASGTATALAYKSAVDSIGAPGINTGDFDARSRFDDSSLDEDVFPEFLTEDEFQSRDIVQNYRAESEGFSRVRGEMLNTLREAEVLDDTEVSLKYDNYDIDRGGSAFALQGGSLRERGRNAIQQIREGFSEGRRDINLSGMFEGSFLDEINQATAPQNIFADEDITDLDVEESRSQINELGDRIRALPDHSFNIENEEDLDRFAAQLGQAQRAGNQMSDTFGDLDDDVSDSLINQSNSARELRRNLSQTDFNTERLEDSLDDLGGTTREIVDDMLAGAQGTEEFDEQVGDLGSRAGRAAASISGMSGVTKEYTASTAIAAERTDEFGDELRETGNEAIASQMKIAATSNAVGSLQEMIGDTSTQFGPFRMQLSSVAQLLPGLISMFASLGGVLTTGLAGGAGLAGIFAGGILQQGEQLVDTMEAAGTATEEMQEAEGMERTMLGVEEIMSRIGEAAYEAMEPLRQPEFGQFAMWGIDQALQMLNEFAQVVAWGSDELMNAAEVISAAWWDNYPTFIGELVNLMEVLGPLLTDLAVGGIELLPAVFAMMASEGETVVPLLMDFASALLDLMPALLSVGTLMLQGILPNLTGFIEGISVLTPAITFFARTLTDLIAVFDPVVEAIFAIGGAAMTLNSIIPFLTVSLIGLRTVFLALVRAPVRAFLSSLYGAFLSLASVINMVTASAGLMWGVVTGVGIVAVLAGVVTGILAQFNLLDEAIWGLIQVWNVLVEAFSYGGAFLANAAIGFVNMILGALNKLIDGYNWIAERVGFLQSSDAEFEKKETYDYGGNLDYLKGDRETANNIADMVPGQDSSGEDPLSSQFQSGEEGYRGPDRLASGDVRQENNYYMQGVGGSGEGMSQEKRVEEAVRRGVKRANRRSRLQNSDMQ